MQYDLSARLTRLRKYRFWQSDLIPVLDSQYHFGEIAESFLSNYINGKRQVKNADMVLAARDEIVSAKEKEFGI